MEAKYERSFAQLRKVASSVECLRLVASVVRPKEGSARVSSAQARPGQQESIHGESPKPRKDSRAPPRSLLVALCVAVSRSRRWARAARTRASPQPCVPATLTSPSAAQTAQAPLIDRQPLRQFSISSFLPKAIPASTSSQANKPVTRRAKADSADELNEDDFDGDEFKRPPTPKRAKGKARSKQLAVLDLSEYRWAESSAREC